MDPSSLSEAAKATLRQHRGGLCVSAISAFEIGQKNAAGKLVLPFEPREWFSRACQAHGLTTLPLMPEHGFLAASLPLLHCDPFDRLLIATACDHNMPLLSPDPLIRQYTQISTVW